MPNRSARRAAIALSVAALLIAAPMRAGAQAPQYFKDAGAATPAPYSAAVAANGFVFVSGVVPVAPESGRLAGPDFEAQAHQVFANLKRALALAGAALDDVVKVTVYLKTAADFPAMNRIYASQFSERLPARTTVPGMGWGNDLRIEIDAIAVDRRRARGESR